MTGRGGRHKHRTKLFMVLVIIMVCGIPMLAAEAFVRIMFRYNSPDTVRQHSLHYVATDFARHVRRPGQQIRAEQRWGLKSGDEMANREYRISNLGYLGLPFSIPKKEGTRRIVILGGSSVFDPAATEGRDWPHLVEEKLKARGFPTVEVLNAGVPGHATADSLGRFYTQIWTLQPDYVLVDEAWNDIKYFTEVSAEHPLLWSVQPYDEGADPFQNYTGILDRVMCLSQTYVKLRTRHLIWKLQPGSEGAARSGNLHDTFDATALRQYRLDLELLVDGARDIGAVPVLMTQGTLVTPQTSESDRKRIVYSYEELNHDGLVKAFAGCEDAVRQVSKEKDVAVIDAARVMSGRSELFEDHVHLSARGGEVISGLVADYLEEELKSKVPVQAGAILGVRRGEGDHGHSP